MWFFRFIVLMRYSWMFFWSGGEKANHYLRYAEKELRRIEAEELAKRKAGE